MQIGVLDLFVVAGAVVGVTAIQSMILRDIVQVTHRRLVARNTRAEAMEWLALKAQHDAATRRSMSAKVPRCAERVRAERGVRTSR